MCACLSDCLYMCIKNCVYLEPAVWLWVSECLLGTIIRCLTGKKYCACVCLCVSVMVGYSSFSVYRVHAD